MKPTVFVVDDDKSFLRSTKRLLESENLPVAVFPSGEAFFENYQTGQPGCLLLDLMMPGMTGLDVLQMMRELELSLPTIVMTAFGNVPSAVNAMKLGAIDFIEKPIHKNAELKRLIRQALDSVQPSKRAQQEIQQAGVRLRTLTERELQILDRLLEGLSSQELANEFGLSLATVNSHRSNILEKMEASSTQSLIGMVSRYRHAQRSRKSALKNLREHAVALT